MGPNPGTSTDGAVRRAAESRRVALLTVVGCIATAAPAIYVEMGVPFAVPLIGAAVVALVAWSMTSFRHPGESDGVVVLYIAGIVALMVEHAEQWLSRTPELVARLASRWAAPGFVFNERILIAGFAIASPALFLLGGFFLVRRHLLGDYMAWLLFVWSLVAGLLQGALAVSCLGALGVTTGIATCVPPLLLGALGARRLIVSSRALSRTVMP